MKPQSSKKEKPLLVKFNIKKSYDDKLKIIKLVRYYSSSLNKTNLKLVDKIRNRNFKKYIIDELHKLQNGR